MVGKAREEGCCFPQELVVFVQFGDLSAQGFEFGASIQGQFPGRFAGLGGSFGGNPLAQRLGTDTQLPGDFGDRAAGVDDQSGSLVLVLGAEGSPGSSAGGVVGHSDILSCGTGPAKQGAHSTRVGPLDLIGGDEVFQLIPVERVHRAGLA